MDTEIKALSIREFASICATQAHTSTPHPHTTNDLYAQFAEMRKSRQWQLKYFDKLPVRHVTERDRYIAEKFKHPLSFTADYASEPDYSVEIDFEKFQAKNAVQYPHRSHRIYYEGIKYWQSLRHLMLILYRKVRGQHFDSYVLLDEVMTAQGLKRITVPHVAELRRQNHQYFEMDCIQRWQGRSGFTVDEFKKTVFKPMERQNNDWRKKNKRRLGRT